MGRRATMASGCDISRNTVWEGETEGGWKPKHALKGPTYRLSHSLGTHQALTLGFSRETEAREVLQTYGKRLSCVASEQGVERRPPLPVCWSLLPCSQMVGAIFPVLSHRPHVQNWILIGLLSSAHSTLLTPWDSALPILHNVRGFFPAGNG